jgi:hypothetical protein
MSRSSTTYAASAGAAGGRVSRLVLILALAIPNLFSMSAEAVCSVKSDAQRAVLIELYTSEGCSDCPPADKWLSRFKRAPASGAHIVPLAYHVDYWDDMGWKDPFSQAEFGQRQHAAIRRQHGRTVFTPQILVDGRTLLQWSDEKTFAGRVDAITKLPAGAQIELSMDPQSDRHWRVNTTVSGASRDAVLYLALFESGLVSQVTRGENSGKKLHHDFVVRRLAGPFPLAPSGRTTRNATIAIPAGAKPKNMGIAAFVQRPANGQTLQAVYTLNCRAE